MDVSDVVSQFPDTDESDWRRVDEGWAHKDARIAEAVQVLGPALFRGGDFWGGKFRRGKFYDGIFRDGKFRGGEFWGGAFWDGVFYDGEFHGGEFYDGRFRGGVFWDGKFEGGVFHDGEFHGGEFRGGEFHDGKFYDGIFWGGKFLGGEYRVGEYYRGVFHDTPLQLLGVLPWPVNVCGPREVQIDTMRYTLDEWESQLPELLRKHCITKYEAKMRTVLQTCRKWFEDNPDCVTEEDG